MHEIHGRSEFRRNDYSGIKLSSVGQISDGCRWLGTLCLNCVLFFFTFLCFITLCL